MKAGFDDVGFALVLGVIGGDDCRADDLLFPGVLSLSSIACIVGNCLPLGATRDRPGKLGLSSEVSLPPVSKLCEEFDCVPAAGAAACPANENALSLLSSSAICKVRGYPLVGSVGDLRLITCESGIISDMCICSRDVVLLVNDNGQLLRHESLFLRDPCSLGVLSQNGCHSIDPFGWSFKMIYTWDI